MDILANVAQGFAVALQPVNLLSCFIGVFIGTLVGVLPGIGPVSAMSLLLPVTLAGSPEAGIIMMAGIYYGSMYGGSTTSILVNIPGEAASVVTCLDGHQMARQGRAGPALGIAALGSFFAGTFAIVALMLVAPALASVAIAFGPAEYFSLMVLGLTVLTFLTQGSMAKALLMACVGAVLGLIGLDSITAQPRLTFDRMELYDGIGLVPVVMGLFGIAEVLLEHRAADLAPDPRRQDHAAVAEPRRLARQRRAGDARHGARLLPRHPARRRRGDRLVCLLRAREAPLEDAGAVRARRHRGRRRPRGRKQRRGRRRLHPADDARHPAERRHGAPAGRLHHPRAAARAADDEPEPGPVLGRSSSACISATSCCSCSTCRSSACGRSSCACPTTCCSRSSCCSRIVGVYCSSNNVFDVYVMIAFGILGYLMRKTGYEPAPLVLAFVLGPMLENNLRKALILSQGELTTFLTRPISAACLLFAAVLLRVSAAAGARAASARRWPSTRGRDPL